MIGLDQRIECPGTDDLMRLGPEREWKDPLVERLICQPLPGNLRRERRGRPDIHDILIRDKGCATTLAQPGRLLIAWIDRKLSLIGQQRLAARSAVPDR